MMDVNDVRDLYFDITKVVDAASTPPLQSALQHLRDRIDMVLDEIEHRGDSRWFAPTPWHAAIFCTDVAASAVSGVPLDEKRRHIKNIGEVGGTPAMLFCFRGEGNASRPLCPNFHRLASGTTSYDDPVNKERRDWANKMISCFVPLLKHATDECIRRTSGIINWDKQLFVAAAQHYQIPTEFMDWTTDPFVAIAFGATTATRPDNEKHNAVVYMLPMHRAVELGASFFLPPPYIERLYLQRGFFIRTDSLEGDKELQDACLVIEFPRNSLFEVIRDGAAVELMIKDDWIEEVKGWSESWINANPGKFLDDEDEVTELLPKLKKCLGEIGLPTYLDPSNGVAIGQLWLTRVLNMIERFTHLRTNEGLKLNQFILRAVSCSNRRLMQGVARLLFERSKSLGPDRGKGDQQLAGAIVDALKSCASRHEIAERAYRIWRSAGSTHGHDVQDWLNAENELVGAAHD